MTDINLNQVPEEKNPNIDPTTEITEGDERSGDPVFPSSFSSNYDLELFKRVYRDGGYTFLDNAPELEGLAEAMKKLDESEQ